ncbi:hypothetical protein RJT34_19989 [Clitoria ternatea]|uniref:Cyclotide n=1 Tax=Clitoria ternatea TaxID=43366 RepID=A0AAN9IS20_CLITE
MASSFGVALLFLFGVSPHTWSYDFAETCVFGKQSPRPGHYDPLCEEAPLLPKLRGYFTEFLRESYLAPLGIIYLPTCVDFRYRYPFVEGRSSFSLEYRRSVSQRNHYHRCVEKPPPCRGPN